MSILMLIIPTLLIMTSMIFLMKSSNQLFTLTWPLNTDPNLPLEATFISDWMSLPFALTILTISSGVWFFSMSYINSKDHMHFFITLTLFIMSMIILIFTDNIILLILGWDGLGLTSYILVMFYQNASSSSSGNITLLSNRIGDMAILTAIALSSSNMTFSMLHKDNFNNLTILFLITAAISKSAQFPLSAWLPAAMAAPTPISALVHSSTLVTAGAFITIRIMNHPSPTATLLMIISATTALTSGLAALWEQDMKKVIALSTLSQIAMICFTSAIGLPKTAFLHMNTHALFKSTLFLSMGYLIHHSSYQDSRFINTQQKSSPLINNSLIITNMALMGIPFTTGYYSKDAILENMMISNTSFFATIAMFMTIGLTAAYSLRMMNLLFPLTKKNNPLSPSHHEIIMNMTLMILLPASIITGAAALWLLNNNSTPTLSPLEKLSTLIMITLSLLTSNLLQYKNKNYLHSGMKAISLWNMHPSTSFPTLKFTTPSLKMQILDNTWNETNPTNASFKLINHSYYTLPYISSQQTLFISLTLLPIMMFLSL